MTVVLVDLAPVHDVAAARQTRAQRDDDLGRAAVGATRGLPARTERRPIRVTSILRRRDRLVEIEHERAPGRASTAIPADGTVCTRNACADAAEGASERCRCNERASRTARLIAAMLRRQSSTASGRSDRSTSHRASAMTCSPTPIRATFPGPSRPVRPQPPRRRFPRSSDAAAERRRKRSDGAAATRVGTVVGIRLAPAIDALAERATRERRRVRYAAAAGEPVGDRR